MTLFVGKLSFDDVKDCAKVLFPRNLIAAVCFYVVIYILELVWLSVVLAVNKYSIKRNICVKTKPIVISSNVFLLC